MAVNQREKGETFRALHEGEPFVIANPWDAGSARVLQGLGFEALATTSGGFAFTLGRDDGTVTLDEVASHVAALAEASDLPLSVDLENGYGPAPEDAARAVTRAAEAGAVGGSIEDFDQDERRIYETEQAAERIAAAAEAAAALDFPFTLTARAENHFRGNPDLDDTITRLRAYEDAGADVVYAPALRTAEEMRAVCEAVSKPVNVLAWPKIGLKLDELAALGVQRISLGSSLTLAAANAAIDAARRILENGDFSGLGRWTPVEEALGG